VTGLPHPIIDFHTHIGKLYTTRPRFTPRKLISRMDQLGIDRAVVLPIENPEETHFYVTTEQVLRAARRYRDRLIPFCNVDPRRGNPRTFDPYPIMENYVSRGCQGFGELLAGLPLDHPLMQRIYRAAGQLGIPIVLHIDRYRCIDQPGLPRLEQMARKYPKTVFIGHGPHWWAEISADAGEEDRQAYPSGPVKPGGRVHQLLQSLPNIYADISANSGYNALARDPQHAKRFLEQNQDKLLFGTDLLWERQEIRILDLLEKLEISSKALHKILHKNAEKLLNL